jgi:dynein light chain roadblock-type
MTTTTTTTKRAVTDRTRARARHARVDLCTPQGVLGTIVVNEDGEAVRATTVCDASGVPLEDQNAVVKKYASLVPQLASMARNMVRDLDPQNDLRFLRVRSRDHEMMVHSDPEFTLIVIQNPSAAE